MSFLNKLPRITMFVLLGITIVVAIFYFVGGEVDVTYNNNPYAEPVYTDLLLRWTYVPVALAIFLTLAFVVVKFVTNAIDNPKSAIRPLCILVGGVLLFVIAYALGDGTTLKLTGYEGSDNTYGWLKVTDMLLYVTYALSLTAVGVIIYAGVSKYFK